MKHISQLLGGSRNPPQEVRQCLVHGDYVSVHWRPQDPDRWTPCMACVADEAKQRHYEEGQRNTEDTRVQLRQRLEDAGIPERFRELTFKTYQASHPGQINALRECREYAENWTKTRQAGKCMLLVGGPGTGKTHLAVAICYHVLSLNKSVHYTSVAKAMRRIKESWSSESGEVESQVIEAYVSPDLLVLDEVGVQFGSNTEKDLLFSLVNDRYNEGKPTLLISNLELEKVREYLGDRILDRLRDSGGKAVKFDWVSFRKGRV